MLSLGGYMKTISIDFSEIKDITEVHLLLKEKLGFPEWYGENLDALWDLVTGYIEPCIVELSGFEIVSEDIRDDIQKVLAIFLEAEEKYGQIKVICVE